MDKRLCAALYELEFDKFSYSHPYHKIVITKNAKTDTETVNQLKRQTAFTFEGIPKRSLDFNFKPKRYTYSPEPQRPSSSNSSKINSIRLYKYRDFLYTRTHFQASQDSFNKIRIKGSSANMLKRRQDSSPTKSPVHSGKISIRVKIKSVRNSTTLKN